MKIKVKAISPHVLNMEFQKKWYEKYPKLWDIQYKLGGKLQTVRNFLFGKYNIVKIDAWKWHHYHEVEEVMFHASFQILVNYVEHEVVHMFLLDNPGRPKTPDPAAGLKYLDWEIELGGDSPSQSAAAKEVKELYLWYTSIRPNRPDQMKDFPCPVPFEEFADGDLTEEQKILYSEWGKRHFEFEEKQDKEDDEMLIRLIKIRRSMWT